MNEASFWKLNPWVIKKTSLLCIHGLCPNYLCRRDYILMPVKYCRLYFFIIVVSILISVSIVKAADDDLVHVVIFKGISNKALLADIQSISDAYNIGHQIESSYLLQKMADSDTEKFLQLFKARGFYDASVKSEIDAKKELLKLTFIFETGKPYLLKSVKLQFADNPGEDGPKLPGIDRLGLVLNKPFSSQAVLDGQAELITIIRSRGFPFVKISKRDVIVDHQDQSVSVNFYIDAGPKAFFGRTNISGLEKVDESYIMGKLAWKEGEIFNGNLIEETRKDISELGLFTLIRITQGKDLDDTSKLPMTIEVTERKHKTVSVGLKYLTDEGPGAKVSWENRNIFHHGERLKTFFELSKFTTAAETDFTKLDFLQKDQTFSLSLRASDEHPEAYDSRSITGSGYLNRELTKIISIGAGMTLKSSTIDQLGYIESYNLLSLPIHAEIDKNRDIFDPVKGYYLSLQLTPFYQTSGEMTTFGKALVNYKRFVRISTSPQIVIAAEVTASMIRGTTWENIPADERLYAGGGGSVRGYEYQSVGPLFEGAPLGGKSLFESSLEFRLKLTEGFGIVAFLDGGSAFAEDMFEPEYPLLWGTGLGLRYYTPVGPFRLDVAVPLNKRVGIDNSYQLYISIGHAF
jgi:translocation and assembly module TamA